MKCLTNDQGFFLFVCFFVFKFLSSLLEAFLKSLVIHGFIFLREALKCSGKLSFVKTFVGSWFLP